MTRVVIVTVFIALCALPALASPEATIAGHWEGPIHIPQMKLEVLVDLFQTEDGTWMGTIDIPMQGARGLPLEDISFDGSTAVFTIVGPPGDPTFTGTLSEDGVTIAGDFAQGGQTFRFELSRTGEARAGTALPKTDDALAGFDGFVEETMAQWNVVGAGVAIVKNGEPVLVKGYGYRNLEEKVPVTENTLFAIGSASKGFTSLILGMLVDDGLIRWDEPVRTYLPDFALDDDCASEEMTPRDLVCHRSGLPRHDLVWYGSPLTRTELVQRLRYLEPNVGFRETFQYQNLMFMTAGYLAGKVTGTSWETLVEERIFAPLGMEASNLSVDEMQEGSDFAYGYQEKMNEKTKKDEIERMPFRNIDAVGPAGSINSSAADMAKWVAFQTSHGEAGGEKIVQPQTLAELHSPQMVVRQGLFAQLLQQPEMPYIMYGLGWFIQPYRGHEMIHHGGNIDGFSAFVAFLPKDNIGIVVLTNANGTLLPEVLAFSVFDRFIGLEKIDWHERFQAAWAQFEQGQEAAKEAVDITRESGTRPSHPLEDYAGRYAHPAYGSVDIERDGKTFKGTHHGEAFELEHWHYDVFRVSSGQAEGMKLAFLTNLNGDIDRVSVAMEPSVAPIEFAKQPPEEMSDPDFLARFEGEYELMGLTAVVALKGSDRLTLTVPGQPIYDLVPYMGTEFKIASHEGYSARFVVEKDRVTRVVFIQPNGVFPAEKKK
jgi:CubicO group peptidase (beta-lactamase class C family)